MKEEDKEIFWKCLLETLEDEIDSNSNEFNLEIADKFDVLNKLVFNICNHYESEEKLKK